MKIAMRMNRIVQFLTYCVISVIVTFAFLAATGHLTDGPVLTDENQIYRLQVEFAEDGFWSVLGTELESRFEMERLVPIYSIQKIVRARLFGGNLFFWSLWTGLVTAVTAAMLFQFARLCDGSWLSSLAFALICVIGEQTVISWRVLQGENIGMLLLSSALVAMALQVRTGKLRYEASFILLAVLAMLSKESFILTIPAILFLKLWLTARQHHLSLWPAITLNWLSLALLSLGFVVALAVIRFVFASTSFNYTGWKGFETDRFLDMLFQYALITNSLLLLLLLAMGAWSGAFMSRAAIKNVSADGNLGLTEVTRGLWTGQPWASLLAAAVFCVLMVLPQLLLYMSSGMLNINAFHFGRYVVPSIIGYAFLVAEAIRLIQQDAFDDGTTVGVLVILLGLSIADKSVTAYQEAVKWAEKSQLIDAWFETVVDNSDRDSSVVLAFDNNMVEHMGLRTALHAYYILSECYDRKNVYFLPLPDQPTIAATRAAIEFPSPRRHLGRIQTIEQLDMREPPDAIMVLSAGMVPGENKPMSFQLARQVREQWPAWFDRYKYRREISLLGHITFFLTDELGSSDLEIFGDATALDLVKRR